MEMGGESQLEMDKVENVMEMVTQKGAEEYGDKKVRRSFLISIHSQSLPPSDQIWKI